MVVQPEPTWASSLVCDQRGLWWSSLGQLGWTSSPILSEGSVVIQPEPTWTGFPVCEQRSL